MKEGGSSAKGYTRLSSLLVAGMTAAVFAACGGGQKGDDTRPAEFDREATRKAMVAAIGDLEEKARGGGDKMDKALAADLISSYIAYSNNFHEDTLSGEYLMRAASIADRMGRYQQAIELLTNFYEGFPSSGRKAEAAYLVAFIYDAHLNNKDKAASHYQFVIDQHPGTTWATQAEAALRIVHMDEEELLRFLEQQNAQ